MHESTVSTVLGFLVIVVVGLLIVNYFRNLDSGETFPTTATTESENGGESYTVAAGDSLWSISEKVYGTGYNWVDIRDANNIENPDDLEEGQVLVIPKVEAEGTELAEAPSPSPVASASPVPTLTITATPKPTTTPRTVASAQAQPEVKSINAGGTYTVVRGDNLWNIAVAAYGDGFKWVEIAKANALTNPQIIHAGNVLKIPA